MTDRRHSPTGARPKPPERPEQIDGFAAVLDALIRGEMPGHGDTSTLAATARQIQLLDGITMSGRQTTAAHPLDRARKDRIWEELMMGRAHPDQPTEQTGPPSQPALAAQLLPGSLAGSARRRRRRGGASVPAATRAPRSNRSLGFVPDTQPAITAFFVVALLVAAVAGFSGLGPPGNSDVTPTAHAHESSTQDTASPETHASPECAVDPRPSEEFGEILGPPKDWSGRHYVPAQPAVARAIADAAYGRQLCPSYQSGGGLPTLDATPDGGPATPMSSPQAVAISRSVS